ncbi:MAG: response regulator, partial [Gemmatimonadetes bacterium]|nr:response regulator [Gemmatimonadota bacterium]
MIHAHPSATVQHVNGSQQVNGSPVSVLMVDDDPRNLLAFEAMLGELGLNLVRASSGMEALKALLIRDFALILLDVQMAGLDGFETATLIRERERSRHIPIIFVTAISREDVQVFRGYSVGAVDYLFKPVMPEVLRAKVAVFVDLYRKTQEIRRQGELLRDAETREHERQLAEARRQANELSEQRYRTLAEAIPQMVWSARPDGDLDWTNRRWSDYTGLTPEQMRGVGWHAAVHPEDLQATVEDWQRAIRTGDAYESEIRLRSGADGAFRWHLARAVPVRDAEERILCWFGTCTDVDFEKRASGAVRFLAEASAALASSLDYQTTLASVARLAVPHVADWCLVDMIEADGSYRRLALAHADPACEELAWNMERIHPMDPCTVHGAPHVLRTGRSELVERVDEALRAAKASDAVHLAALRELGMQSYM